VKQCARIRPGKFGLHPVGAVDPPATCRRLGVHRMSQVRSQVEVERRRRTLVHLYKHCHDAVFQALIYIFG
jgi:hypothetical protein